MRRADFFVFGPFDQKTKNELMRYIRHKSDKFLKYKELVSKRAKIKVFKNDY